MLAAVPPPSRPVSTSMISASMPRSPSTPVPSWTTGAPPVSSGESADKRKQFIDPDGRLHLLHSTSSAVADSEVSLFLRRCTDPSRIPFFTTGEGIKLDSAKASRTIALQASRLHLESGSADATVGSTTGPSWFHASTHSSFSSSTSPISLSVWSSTSMYFTVRDLPIFYDTHFDLLLRGQWGEGSGMLNLSYFSLHFNADSWVSLHEALRNVESVFVVVFGSGWELCLRDLSQAMLSHLAWRVYPAHFMHWIVELAITNFFLLATQCYSPGDVQSRYPGAPDSLLRQCDVVSLFRVMVQSINPSYSSHQYFLTEVEDRLGNLYPYATLSTVASEDISVHSGMGTQIIPTQGELSLDNDCSHAPSKKLRTGTTMAAPSPPKGSLPCLRHLASLFKVTDAPACRDAEDCKYAHYHSKRAVPIQSALDLLLSNPPRTFTTSITEELSRRLTKRAQFESDVTATSLTQCNGSG